MLGLSAVKWVAQDNLEGSGDYCQAMVRGLVITGPPKQVGAFAHVDTCSVNVYLEEDFHDYGEPELDDGFLWTWDLDDPRGLEGTRLGERVWTEMLTAEGRKEVLTHMAAVLEQTIRGVDRTAFDSKEDTLQRLRRTLDELLETPPEFEHV